MWLHARTRAQAGYEAAEHFGIPLLLCSNLGNVNSALAAFGLWTYNLPSHVPHEVGHAVIKPGSKTLVATAVRRQLL